MKRIGLLIAFVAALVFFMPLTSAQDGKKKDEVKKDEVKKDEKKDPDKKDEKKDPPEKKDPEKKTKEKFVYGNKFQTTIRSIKPEGSREITVEVQEIDKNKVAAVEQWAVGQQQALGQRTVQLAQQLAQANSQKDLNARRNALAQYARDNANHQAALAKFQIDLTRKRATEIYTPKNVDLRGAENSKVRTNFLPIEFDDNGFQKKLTPKEKEARKDKIGLPGFYPSEFEALKPGQLVEVYMVRQVVEKKVVAKKKGPDDDDPPMAKTGQEYLLIVILGEGKQP